MRDLEKLFEMSAALGAADGQVLIRRGTTHPWVVRFESGRGSLEETRAHLDVAIEALEHRLAAQVKDKLDYHAAEAAKFKAALPSESEGEGQKP